MGFLVTLKQDGKISELWDRLSKVSSDTGFQREYLVLIDRFHPAAKGSEFFKRMTAFYKANADKLGPESGLRLSDALNIIASVDYKTIIGSAEDSEGIITELVGEAPAGYPRATDLLTETDELPKEVKKRTRKKKDVEDDAENSVPAFVTSLVSPPELTEKMDEPVVIEPAKVSESQSLVDPSKGSVSTSLSTRAEKLGDTSHGNLPAIVSQSDEGTNGRVRNTAQSRSLQSRISQSIFALDRTIRETNILHRLAEFFDAWEKNLG